MLGKLKALFSKGGADLPKDMTYDKAKELLEVGELEKRKALASRQDAAPEMLYYLTEDDSAEVRRLVAANPSTPMQADSILVDDKDDEVRQELARKIGRIVPDLDNEENKALRDKAITVLEELAQDQLPKVRAVVANAIKESTSVPKPMVKQLAKDIEDMVCGPILEYSPLLNDDDLREIIAAGASSTALKAMASRPEVSEDVSQTITDTLDIPAVAALLTNENAFIREDTLDQIISQAENVEGLHKPVALRPQLSIRAMKRIAGFVASALVHVMIEKSDLEEDHIEEIMEKVRTRLSDEKVNKEDSQKYADQAQDFFARGILNDDFVVEQITEGNRETLLHCLALMADINVDIVRKIMLSKSGRAVTALAWRAQLKMRTAYEMQTKLALVPNAQLLSAKNGTDYPIDEDELDWHLSYFLDQTD